MVSWVSTAHAAEPALTFVRHDLHAGALDQVTQGMGVGDLDGDGRPDLVVGGDRHLLVYVNPTFTASLIADGFKFGGGAAVTPRDFDGDGRIDVMTGRYPFDDSTKRETVWYENTPSGWLSHRVSAIGYCHDVAFADFDGDGRADFACADLFRDELAWLGAPADPRDEWTVHTIDGPRRVQGAAAADVDRDGRVDVVSGRAWYRNVAGTDGLPSWQRVPLTTRQDDADRRFDDYAKVSVLDLDGDGRLDVFATLFADSREGEVWAFFQPDDPVNEPWPALQIDVGPLFGVHSQGAGSFDGTARPQLMVGETNIGGFGFGPNPSPQIWVYRRIGDARSAAGWERILVDDRGTHEAQVLDLDGDGLADIAGDEENTELIAQPRHGIVSWWQAMVPAPPGCTKPGGCTPPPPPGPTSCDDPSRCPATVACDDPARRALAATACVCREAAGAACTEATIPPSTRRRWQRTCALVDRAATAPTTHAMTRRARSAARDTTRLIRQLARAGTTSAACTRALKTGLADVRDRLR